MSGRAENIPCSYCTPEIIRFDEITIDFYKEKPVPDSIFQVYKEQFSYDRGTGYQEKEKAVLNIQINRHQLRFGHFFDGVFEAFADESALFDASAGHVVDAECGDVVDDDAAHI